MPHSGPRCCAFLHSSQLVGKCFRLSSPVFSFLLGSEPGWKDRFLNDVTVSILYFITPYCCHLSFVVVFSRILLISPKVKNVLSLVSMLALEPRGRSHPLKK